MSHHLTYGDKRCVTELANHVKLFHILFQILFQILIHIHVLLNLLQCIYIYIYKCIHTYIHYIYVCVFFPTIYSLISYFIFGFGAGNIYLSCIAPLLCIVLLAIKKHFILLQIFTPFSILSYYDLYNIMYCSFLMTHKSTQTFIR